MRTLLFTVGVAICLTTQCGPARADATLTALARLCPHHRDLAPPARAAAHRYLLHPGLLVALMRVESHCRMDAVSHKGAVCGMQLLGVARNGHTRSELADPATCIETGARWLAMMEVWCGSLERGLGAYNTGHCDRGRGFSRHVLRRWR